MGGVAVGGGSHGISWHHDIGGRAGRQLEPVRSGSWNPCGPVVVDKATVMATQGREGSGKGQVWEVWESKRRGEAMGNMRKHTAALACGLKEKTDSPSIVFCVLHC